MFKEQKKELTGNYDCSSLERNFPYRHNFTRLWTKDETPPARTHYHDAVELGLCRDGAGVFTVGRKIMPFKTGDMVVINAMEPHEANGLNKTSTYWDFFFLDPVALIGALCEDMELVNTQRLAGEAFINVIDGDHHPRLLTLLSYLADIKEIKSAAERDLVRGILLSFFSILHSEVEKPPASDELNKMISTNAAFFRITPALSQIQRRHTERLKISNLATLCNMCVSGFRRHFSEAMGCSPQKYLSRYRVLMASVDLLHGDKSIEEVASSHGYPDRSSFFRDFKNIYGVAPGRWRKTAANSKPGAIP